MDHQNLSMDNSIYTFSSNTSSISPSWNSHHQLSSVPIIDKLRTIKPFDEKQLFHFYQNLLLDNNEAFIKKFVERYVQNGRNEQYETVVRLERSLERFNEINQSMKSLITSIEELETKCWNAKQQRLVKSDRCGDGQLVEADHQFLEYEFDRESAMELEQRYYYVLKERLVNDHIVGQYQYKYAQLQFELMLYEMLEMVKRYMAIISDETKDESPQQRLAKEQLQDWIAALFVYYRKVENYSQQLKTQCFESLILLSHEYLKIATLEDKLFLLNHVLRCPSGCSEELESLIDCPNPLPLRIGNYEHGKQLVDYEITVIDTILSTIVDRDKFINHSSTKNRSSNLKSQIENKEPWIMVDTDFEDDQFINSPLEITEFDLIHYLERVPFEDILKFMSLISEDGDPELSEQFVQSTEVQMMKLFSFNTRLIQILRGALKNFNYLRYKELTVKISFMVKQIIRNISNQWCWCKDKFNSVDQSFLVRLQVEFDNFMLRSIMTMLSTNRRGVWPLLAQIEFIGISQPMLWHIVWVVYNNGNDNNNELSGLCPYMSANYWKDKFANFRQWKFVFIERLSNFSREEATGVIEFFYNMACSRDERLDLEFLQEIVRRIGEICLLKKCYLDSNDVEPSQTNQPESELDTLNQGSGLEIHNQSFYQTNGIKCLINLLNQFKSLTTIMLQFVGEQREGNLWIDLCQTVFESIHFDDFIPDGKFFYIVYGWLNDLHPSNILNRLARIVLSKLDWNRILIQTDQCLLFSEEVQRRHALKLYHSLMNQLKIQTENQESIKNPIKMSIKSINRDSIGISNMLRLAKSTQLIDYISWTWSNLLILRIHPLDLIPNECSWDEIIFGTHNIDTLRIIKKVNYKHRIFQQLPRINFDNEVVSIAKALELHGDESDPFAGYIALMMTDLINKHNDPGKYLEICFQTLARPNSVMHHIPLLSLLYHLIPLYVHQWETLCSNQKFIQIILELLQKQYTEELSSIILEHMKHFHYGENAAQMAIVWSEILFETMYLALVQASRGGSWLSSWTGSSLVTTQQHLEMIFEQLTLIFDRLAEQIIVSNCGSNNEEKNLLFIQYIKYLVERPFTKHNNSSSSIVSKLTTIIESPNQSTPTVTPNSSTQTSSSWSLFNFLPWSSGDDTDIYYLVDKNILKSEWCTPFHIMLRQRINRKIAQQQQNFKSSVAKKLQRQPVNEKPIVLPFYLAYLVIESDIRKSGRIWDHLVYTINNFDIAKASVSTDKSELVSIDFELELKNVCKTLEKPTIPYSLLPINSLIVWLLNSTPPSLDLSSPKEFLTSPHPMIPLLWKNFFQLYFSHSGIGSSSIGLQFIGSIFLERMQHRLTLLFDHHNRLWLQLNNQKAVNLSESSNQPKQSDLISSLLFEDRLLKLYRAYRLWLTDPRLHSSFVNLDDDSDYCQPEFQSNILKFIFSSTSSSNQSSSSRTESPISGKSMSLTSSEQFTTNFFFLNYINKAMLSSEITKFEDFWYNCIKGNKYNCIKREKTSNEAKKTKPINQSSKRPNTLQLSNNKIKTLDEIKKKIGQYKPIIEYFTSLTSTLNVNLLFDDNPYCLDDLSAQQSSLIAHDPSVIIVIIHQLIDTITEEARFVENQLKKYSELNHEFCNDILPKLYQNIRKELNKKISCDREEFDAAGCAKSAIIHFEFIESILDLQAKQRYERNRSDLALVLRTLTKEIPVQKVVGSVYFLKKVLNYQLRYFDGDPNNDWNKTQIRTLLQSMTGWISLLNSVQSAKYFVTGQVLDQLLDMLSQLSPRYDDPINYFLLETSLQRNMNLTMIQQLAPCLSPAKCVDPKTFISMYKLIGDNLANTSQQTVFVLLSKFDVGSWLRSANVNDDQRSEFLNCLYQCLYLFGVTPTDEYLVTFDLYRKHLQDIILYQFPLFMQNILQFMLNGMNEAQLAPTLWSSLLHTFGFYTKSLSFTNHINRTPATTPAIRQQSSTLLDFDYVTFDLDLRGYTVRQTIFTSHELFELIQIMLEFQQFINQESTSEFLDYFKTYASKYLQFISFISYCWIGTNSTPSTCPDDLSIVWNPFIKLWNDWIIPKRSTKFISFEHLNFAWSLFVSSIQFMIDSFSQQRVTYFLSNLWQNFLHFIVETKTETLDEKDVEMFQERLLQITHWSSFDPTIQDIELMYEAVIQNRFNVERFIAFIISRINWRQTLSNLDRRFTNEQLSHIVDNLSCVLIALSNQPYIVEIDLESIPFIVLSPQKVKEITLMLLPMMKQKMQNNKQFTVQLGSSFFNLKRNDSDTEVDEGILLSLLRTVCDVQKNRGLSNQQFSPIHFPKQVVDENWYIMKNLYFTNCIASLVSYYLNSNAEPKSEEVRIFLQFWVEKMNNTLAQLDSNNRILMFESILGSINQVVDESNRKRLSTIFVTVLSYSLPSCIEQLADLIQSINRCVQSISIVVYLLECFIETYLDLNGNLEFLVFNLKIRSSTSPPTTPSNEEPKTSSLITESIRTQSCLLLLVHIYNRLTKSTVPESCTSQYICKLIQSCASFKPNHDESKIILFVFKLFSLLTKPSAGSYGDPVLLKLAMSPNQFGSIVNISTIFETDEGKNYFLSNSNLYRSILTLQTLSKTIHEVITESLNRGWFFFRSTKQSSNWCLFLMECLTLHGISTLLELYYPETIISTYENMFQQQQQTTLANGTKLSDRLIRSSSNDSLTSSGGSPSRSTTEYNSPNSSTSNSNSLLYSESIRIKLRTELIEQFRQSYNRLMKQWKRDKSFQDIWIHIDEINNLFSEQLDRLGKQMDSIHRTWHLQTTSGVDDSELETLSNDERIPVSNNVTEQQQQQQSNMIREQFTKLQRKRFNLIQSWISTFYSDKNYINAFL